MWCVPAKRQEMNNLKLSFKSIFHQKTMSCVVLRWKENFEKTSKTTLRVKKTDRSIQLLSAWTSVTTILFMLLMRWEDEMCQNLQDWYLKTYSLKVIAHQQHWISTSMTCNWSTSTTMSTSAQIELSVLTKIMFTGKLIATHLILYVNTIQWQYIR